MVSSKATLPLQASTYNNLYTHEQTLQERELAYFFLDIRDFTPFIASRPVMEVMEMLQQVFKIFRQAINSNGGTIIETAGDGLYAVFGLEDTLHQAASSAVEAGMAIIRQLDAANHTYFRPIYQHCFQVGMGLHVGKGVVGRMGLGINNQLTVMGYPVNIAARLQQSTKQLNNSFVISADVYRLLSYPPKAANKQVMLRGIPGRLDVFLLGEAYHFSSCRETAWKVAC